MDRLIDDVARVMTEPAPPAGLRGAVLARIERRPARRLSWLALPIAAAAAVVLAIGLPGPSSAPPETPLAQRASSPPAPVLAASPAAVVADAARRDAPARRPSPRALEVRTLPALVEPRALTADDIQPNALAIPLLRMKPIVTEPIPTRVMDDSGSRQ